MQIRLFLTSLLSAGVLFGVSACDHHSEMQHQTQTPSDHEQRAASLVVEDEQPVAHDEAKVLTEVAGRATIPNVVSKHTTQPAPQDLIYVGRYHARIPCTDPFAGCVNGEKEAEYIINLLEDGSVYWMNTSFGRLGIDPARSSAKIEQTCKQVQWQVNGKELMIRCEAAGVNLYYQINQNRDLVLDLDKIWNSDHGQNRQFFNEYPFPQKAYIFEKVK